jgi:phenylacetic acid degradation operon negative regulatory protein
VRARSALFTLFGDVVRPAGGDAWLSTLTTCMGALGFTPEATRTALHRMAAEGWVEPSRVGRYAVYRLTPQGVDRLEEAAARIYRLRAVEWDGRWRLLVCPGAARGGDQASFHRSLRWMGFGRLSGEVWVSPHAHGERLRRLLGDHSYGDAFRFLATGPVERAEDARIVNVAWDLAELRAAHAEFIDRWGAVTAPDDPRDAFTTRIQLVHHWRSFLFLDPGLPGALLPADWLGETAAQVFRTLYQSVEDAAWQYYEQLTDAAPPLVAQRQRSHAASPFQRGLEALDVARAEPAQVS